MATTKDKTPTKEADGASARGKVDTYKLPLDCWREVNIALSSEGWAEGDADRYAASRLMAEDIRRAAQLPPGAEKLASEAEAHAVLSTVRAVELTNDEAGLIKRALKHFFNTKKLGGSVYRYQLMPAFGLV